MNQIKQQCPICKTLVGGLNAHMLTKHCTTPKLYRARQAMLQHQQDMANQTAMNKEHNRRANIDPFYKNPNGGVRFGETATQRK